MPTAGPLLRTKLADRNSNPVRNVGNPNIPGAPGLTVTVDLTFQGVNFKPEDLFDALEAKYGSGKVVSDDDSFNRLGPLRFRVIP
jgi:hypothetical protein